MKLVPIVTALPFALLPLTVVSAVAQNASQSSASPSGTGMQDRSTTTGTTNYPSDPRASSPSTAGDRTGNGVVRKLGKRNLNGNADMSSSSNRAVGTRDNNNSQNPNEAEKRGNGQAPTGADANPSGSDR